MNFKKQSTNVCLIDYGLAHTFRDNQGHHLPLSKVRGRCGNINFMSLNHMNYWSTLFHLIQVDFIGQSRRDDLECLLYNLLYLAEGKFSWTTDRGAAKVKIDDIIFVKENTSAEEYFQNLPSKTILSNHSRLTILIILSILFLNHVTNATCRGISSCIQLRAVTLI